MWRLTKNRIINKAELTAKLATGTYLVNVRECRYRDNNRLGLLLENENGERIAMATVNLINEPVFPNEIFVKDWSENEGMLNFLVENGIVEDTGTTVSTGFVKAHLCKYLHGGSNEDSTGSSPS